VLVEIQDRDRVAIHMPLADVVDAALRGPLVSPKIRMRTREGRVISNVDSPVVLAPEPPPAPPSSSKPLGIFPYGVSRHHVEQTIKELELPVRVLGNLDGAGAVLTLKNHYRRRPDSLRQAESRGLPIHILKSNSVTQVRDALTRIYGVGRQDGQSTCGRVPQRSATKPRARRSQAFLADRGAWQPCAGICLRSKCCAALQAAEREIRPKWRSLGESNPCFRRQRAVRTNPNFRSGLTQFANILIIRCFTRR